jgi:hypothetical protein
MTTGLRVPTTLALVEGDGVWAAIGVRVGLAVRHQTAAIAGMFVMAMVGGGAIAALLPGIAPYLPGAAGSAIVGVNAAGLLAPGIAVAVLAGWAALATITGERLMRRRDIA